MATAPIGSTSSIPAATLTAGLQLQDLLNVMLTNLTHQDPFKPLDNEDFMGQIAQFASLDASQRLNENLGQLVALQALNQTVGLIGKKVSARTDSGTISGTVSAITLFDGAPRLTIKTANAFVPNVTIGQLQTIE